MKSVLLTENHSKKSVWIWTCWKITRFHSLSEGYWNLAARWSSIAFQFVRHSLDAQFRNKWRRRGGQKYWLSRLPDLNRLHLLSLVLWKWLSYNSHSGIAFRVEKNDTGRSSHSYPSYITAHVSKVIFYVLSATKRKSKNINRNMDRKMQAYMIFVSHDLFCCSALSQSTDVSIITTGSVITAFANL